MNGCGFELWEPSGVLVCVRGSMFVLSTGTPITACPHCHPETQDDFREWCEERESSTAYDSVYA